MKDNNINVNYGGTGDAVFSFILNADSDGFYQEENGAYVHQLQFNAEENSCLLFVDLKRGKEGKNKIIKEKETIDSFSFGKKEIENIIKRLEICLDIMEE